MRQEFGLEDESGIGQTTELPTAPIRKLGFGVRWIGN